jgi:hypothetical protein
MTINQVWERLNFFWKNNRKLPWFLILFFMGLALCCLIAIPPAGIAIGVLAGGAGLMSLRPPEMHIRERIGWIMVLAFLVTAEVLAIRRAANDDLEKRAALNSQFESIRSEQQQDFDKTVAQLTKAIEQGKTALDQSQKNFEQTMDKSNEIYTTATRSVEEARTAIDAAVGTGNSYCLANIPPPPFDKVYLYKKGDAPLYNVDVTFWINYGRTDVYPLGDIAAGSQFGCMSGDWHARGMILPLGIAPIQGSGFNFDHFTDTLDVKVQFFARRGEWDQETHYRKVDGKWLKATMAFSANWVGASGTGGELCGNADKGFPVKDVKWQYNQLRSKNPFYLLPTEEVNGQPVFQETENQFSCYPKDFQLPQ